MDRHHRSGVDAGGGVRWMRLRLLPGWDVDGRHAEALAEGWADKHQKNG
ncbi:hypothetical protein [Rhizorhabdus dicambivorans]|nr:hypothetical protein [Rhizorhabdus dicambivorans]